MIQFVAFIIFSFFPSFLNFDKEDINSLKNNIINVYHQHEAEKLLGSKFSSIDITKDGFIRYKRILKNNKTEYYSVKADKINELVFLGTDKGGWVLLNCEPASVIFQTYKDPAGDIDSMTNQVAFPFKAVSVEDLTFLEDNLKKLKTSF